MRRLAHRPRYHFSRISPQPLNHTRKDYLRQRWIYRQQRILYPKRPLGYGLALIPWGWRAERSTTRRRA